MLGGLFDDIPDTTTTGICLFEVSTTGIIIFEVTTTGICLVEVTTSWIILVQATTTGAHPHTTVVADILGARPMG